MLLFVVIFTWAHFVERAVFFFVHTPFTATPYTNCIYSQSSVENLIISARCSSSTDCWRNEGLHGCVESSRRKMRNGKRKRQQYCRRNEKNTRRTPAHPHITQNHCVQNTEYCIIFSLRVLVPNTRDTIKMSKKLLLLFAQRNECIFAKRANPGHSYVYSLPTDTLFATWMGCDEINANNCN